MERLRKVLHSSIYLVLSMLLMSASFNLKAAGTNYSNAPALETLVSGDTVVYNGVRYQYVAPTDDASKLKVSRGMGLIGYVGTGVAADIYNFGLVGYVSPADVAANAVYSAYIADGAFAAGSAKLTSATAVQEMQSVVNNVTNRIESVLNGVAPQGIQVASGTGSSFYETDQEAGMSSGDMDENMYGVWAQVSWSHLKDSATATEFKGDLITGTVGADMMVMDDMLLGLSYSYGRIGNGKTAYNFGEFEHKTHTVAPYLAYRLDDMFSFDWVVGYSHADKDFKRSLTRILNGVVSEIPGDKITGSTDSKRWFTQLHGNAYYQPMENVNMRFRLGYSYIRDKQDEYTNSVSEVVPGLTTNLSSLAASLRTGYMVDKMFEPFVDLGVSYYLSQTKLTFADGAQPQYDKTGYMLGAGVNMYSSDYLRGGLDVKHEFGHGKLKITTVTANIRYMF